jgi:hypothetical protein
MIQFHIQLLGSAIMLREIAGMDFEIFDVVDAAVEFLPAEHFAAELASFHFHARVFAEDHGVMRESITAIVPHASS